MLYNKDCMYVLNSIEKSSIDMIFADPPYFLSNGGKSISNGKVVSVNKGEWDKKHYYGDVFHFTKRWLELSYRVLKKGGTIWTTGTFHNIFHLKRAMDDIGYKVINIIIWHKLDPPPLIYKNKFRFSYEFVIWAKKGYKHYFNYNEMYKTNNKEMQDVWNMPSVSINEKKFGKHPTQKPECLLERIIKASTKEGEVVLDPFMGSGTTCVVAKRFNRNFIGIEKNQNYFNIAEKRIVNTKSLNTNK